MKTAKKSLHLIKNSTEANDQSEKKLTPGSDANTEVSRIEKLDIYQITHRSTDDKFQEEGKPVNKNQLVNRINYINFQDNALIINLKHKKYDKTILRYAKPQPCHGDMLDCLWTNVDDVHQTLKFYDYKNILIPYGQKLIRVEPELIRMDKQGVSLLLPEKGYEVSTRKVIRHACKDITAQLIQNGSPFSGRLLDFNAWSFKIKLKATPPQTYEWINPESTVNLMLSDARETYYSGECKIIRQDGDQKIRTYILKPLKHEIQRFKHKEFRSYRYELVPAPNVIFRHPFTDKRVDLKVMDLSGSGFSVEEDKHSAVLMPGMILPELELNFANSFKIKCSAQVVYRKTIEDEKHGNWVKCGLALLDMNIEDHVKLMSLLHQAMDRNSYICNQVNLDDLWDFFFETGFIYPDKYEYIQKNKYEIKATYEKLYNHNPHIARHFIYQDKGHIWGHMAMIRFYTKTWLIHHHAARKSALNKAGLVVLDQIGRMINDSHRLYSALMDYMICYYRPENKFPNRVFGGAADNINDPKGCSIDTFAYFHHQTDNSQTLELPVSWSLTETCVEDIQELENYYNHISGGLMLEVTDLRPTQINIDSLTHEYRRLGLRRERHLFALRRNDQLKAIFMVNLSNLGLNLSDLTNCINVFIIDTQALHADILRSALTRLTTNLRQSEMPVLLYPVAYADDHNLVYKKRYNLWAFNLQFLDPYFKYINRLLRFI